MGIEPEDHTYEVQEVLVYLADHATKGATSAMSKLAKSEVYTHPDDQIVEENTDEYYRKQ